jgi:hypothetical protein
MTIQMTAEPTAPSFVVGESVTFRLTLQNPDAQPVTVADPLLNEVDPVYSITAPGGAVTPVRLLSARAPGPKIEPLAPPALITMSLPPGGTWSEEIVLDPMLLLTVPGRYGLQATTSHAGQAITSPPASFDVEAAHVTAFAAAPAPPRTADSRLFTAWAHVGPKGAQVVEAVRLERMWGDDQRGKLYSSTLHRGGADPVQQIAVAEALVVRGMDFHGWVAWTQAGTVWAARSNAGKPEGAAEAVHRTGADVLFAGPLAMDGSYDLRLYGVERSAAQAELLRVDVPRGQPGGAKIACRAALPVRPEAALALHADGAASVVVLGGPDGASTVIAAFEDGAPPRVTVLQRLGPWLPGRPLGARRTPDGRVAVTCLAGNPDNPHVARLWSATFGGSPLASLSERHHDLPEIDPAQTRWVSVLLSDAGEHILFRDTKGELRYLPPSGEVRSVSEPLADTPVPELLAAGAEALIAGVRDSGAFTIESLAPHGHRH